MTDEKQRYDFDTAVDRRNEGAIKWETMKSIMGDRAAGTWAVSTADMDFVPAPEIVAALHEGVTKRTFGYTQPTDAYFDAVTDWMRRRHDWRVEKESIATAPGIVAAIYYLLYAMTEPGDGVIIQPPVYAPFAKAVRRTGRELLPNPLVNEGGRYVVDFDDLEEKASQNRAKILILCSPHNPVGRVWQRWELEQIADICLRHDVFVISDEIHFDIVFPPHKHTVFATLDRDLRDRCIVCTSPSKSFNIAGLQISNIVIADKMLRENFMQAALDCGFYSPNCLVCDAVIAAYNKAEPWLEAMLKYVAANDSAFRDALSDRWPQLTISPLEATYLQWLDFSFLGLEPLPLQQLMREQTGIFFEEGYVFGEEGRGFERLNLAYPRRVVAEIAGRIDRVLDDRLSGKAGR